MQECSSFSPDTSNAANTDDKTNIVGIENGINVKCNNTFNDDTNEKIEMCKF